MIGVRRVATALVLAMAVFVTPLALDLCAGTCELHQATAHAAQPTCHHHSSATAHVAPSPVSCGHDHHIVATVAAAPPQLAPTFAVTLAVTPNAVPVNAAMVIGFASLGINGPPHLSPSRGLSVPLRL